MPFAPASGHWQTVAEVKGHRQNTTEAVYFCARTCVPTHTHKLHTTHIAHTCVPAYTGTSIHTVHAYTYANTHVHAFTVNIDTLL